MRPRDAAIALLGALMLSLTFGVRGARAQEATLTAEEQELYEERAGQVRAAEVEAAKGAAPHVVQTHGAIVEDECGHVLFSLDPDRSLAPASITKIMTAMVALDAKIPMDRVVTVSKVEFKEEGAIRIRGLDEGDTIAFGDLMRLMLVASANDCAVLVAREVAGDEAAFCELMNAKAAEIGLQHTHYGNMHGLEQPDHMTCAADQGIIGRYALTHYPFIAQMARTESITLTIDGEEREYHSTDALLSTYPGTIGIKTGSVDSGVTFLGAVRRDNTTLYSAVLDCDTSEGRWADTRALWDWAFAHFERRLLAGPDIRVGRFAYPVRFGWSIQAASPIERVGLVWPSGGAVQGERCLIPAQTEVLGGQSVGAGMWTQGGRDLIACAYTARGLVADASPTLDPHRVVLAFHGIEV